MSALAFAVLALLLVGPVPAILARADWPLRAPRAAIVLWQSIAIAAVLSAFSAGLAIASRLFLPDSDGLPSADPIDALHRLGWAQWLIHLLVLGLTLLVGVRLAVAGVRVAIGTRRRRAHHRMLVDLLGVNRGALRILAIDQPLAYCLPGMRARVVVSDGTLSTLGDPEMAAILSQRDQNISFLFRTWQRHKGGRRQPNRQLTVVSSANAEQNLVSPCRPIEKSCPRADCAAQERAMAVPDRQVDDHHIGRNGRGLGVSCSFSLEHATQGPVHEVDDQAICRHSFLRATEAASLWLEDWAHVQRTGQRL